ncbi:adenine phosphoribosyltransferase [Sporothrix eucalyptigena]|uniref:adenine phosphoribosyltransferase n=1 Tax=Sporothrix eucalyptigena TaxID=1812306 RepID=A0ABP0D549_9PEZI
MTSPVPQSAQSQETSPDASRPTTTTDSTTSHNASGGQSAAAATTAAELAGAKVVLYDALRRFVDFPIKGIVFIDIMPIFRDPAAHANLLRALELQALHFKAPVGGVPSVDVVVGLDARGFLFGPGLALRLGAGFAPVRKQGKLPGPCVTASYEKEYGADYFQIQEDAIKPGQKVLIVDDIIATGGSAAAAGELVRKLGGELVGYLFILEISFLKGREKLGDVPVITLLEEAE